MRIQTITALSSLLLITACGGTNIQEYNISLDETGAAHADAIFAATLNMFEHRVQAIERQQGVDDALQDISLNRNGNEAAIAITLKNDSLIDALTEDLKQEFTFNFMEQVPLEEADIVVAETEGFSSLPLTKEHISWINVDESGQSGVATVIFTNEGEQRKKEIFAELSGTYVGIFIRDMPVYKFIVEETDMNDSTLLINIPNIELARVFADDVNVELHTTITPKN